ncbi:hypothetical protein NBH00_10490 [Paraconexibacter antarcticus]|uniref:GHMP kinase N-terminal domain-containing protein n=1 Tax=Paraconexibacter antarcticus TaxID=2949664 RepID=A0ABY5DX60_9ACTN|nr:hypothetical protein [Paraconexibacter antarcticus]UTI66618.1 hypothetical protein NBH00_10490 [Paraconexibacter antarcticus]
MSAVAGVATARVPARAALAGNPSDGYGGVVLAVCVGGLEASVLVEPAPGAERDVVCPPACTPLVDATLARFRATAAGGAALGPVAVRVGSTIPREVGLAGSSAIVIATLRALGRLTGTPLPSAGLPMVALAVEAEDLGIAAGPQDRVVQAAGGLVAMDFARGGLGTARAVDPAGLPPLLLAWPPAAGTPSGGYHAGLRARFDAGDPPVRAGMARLREHGLAAVTAAERGDHAALAGAIDGSFDARAALGPLDPRHTALVGAARLAGFAANYAGSGGAIVATGGPLPVLRAALAPLGAEVMPLRPA